MTEITLEITNYCPHACSFCSSSTTSDRRAATYMSIDHVRRIVGETDAEIIHLSGGEPLTHPAFYTILCLCQAKVGRRNVRVQTNAIEWVSCNLHVCPGVRVEGLITPEVQEIRILKRVAQGREAAQPTVRFSRNWTGNCPDKCGHTVIRPDGTRAPSPCRKEGGDS